MTRQGSFYPLRRDVASAEPVMFAYVLDQPAQREALQEKILGRIAAIQALSETMAPARLESPTRARTLASSICWPSSHVMCVD
jgi:hypothetical protein